MKTVYVFTRRDTPETYKECTQMDCSDCEFGDIVDNLTCGNRRALYHKAFKAGETRLRQEAIDKILMVCMAFDFSPENNGEETLRQIRKIADVDTSCKPRDSVVSGYSRIG